MSEWQASVPAGMEVSATMLRGHALCETSTALEALARSASGSLQLHGSRASDQSTLVWRYLPLSSLSPLVKTRFQQLFDVRPKWKLADIECYALDLCAPGQTLEQLLLKHARPVSTDNIVNGQRKAVAAVLAGHRFVPLPGGRLELDASLCAHALRSLSLPFYCCFLLVSLLLRPAGKREIVYTKR